MSHFVDYILQFQEIIVYKIPPGRGGVYSQPKIYIKCNVNVFISAKYILHICHRPFGHMHEECCH